MINIGICFASIYNIFQARSQVIVSFFRKRKFVCDAGLLSAIILLLLCHVVRFFQKIDTFSANFIYTLTMDIDEILI